MVYMTKFVGDRFMSNLQKEVLEIEFQQFAHGSATIHEQDFARILLRYTTLTKQAHEQYLDRLAQRIPHSQVRVDWTTHCFIGSHPVHIKTKRKLFTLKEKHLASSTVNFSATVSVRFSQDMDNGYGYG